MLPLLLRAIPSTGETLPAIGLGTWQTFDVGTSDRAREGSEAVLRAFAGMGGRLVDSSPMYRRAEETVGDLAAKHRLHDALFVATKVWTSGQAAGVRQMEESLRKLRTPRIDLLQVHNLLDVDAHLETLRAWKHEGRVRYIGVTHYTATAHQAVAETLMRHDDLDFLQINYSAKEREAEKRLLPMAQDRGMAILANRPFAEGALVRRLRDRALPEWAAELNCRTWPQLLLKFVVSHPAITCAIPATSDVDHLRENLEAGQEPMPDTSLRERIAAAVC